MKAHMQIVRLDDGDLAVLLPSEIVQTLGIKEGDEIEITPGSDGQSAQLIIEK